MSTRNVRGRERRKPLGRKPRESATDAIEIQLAADRKSGTTSSHNHDRGAAEPVIRSKSFPYAPWAGSEVHAGAKCAATKFACDVLVSLDEGTDHEVLHDDFATERGYSSSRRDKTRRREPKPLQETRSPKGLGGWHALLSSCRPKLAAKRWSCTALVCRAFFEAAVARTHTHCSFSRAGSPAPPRVAASAVAFLVATRRWPVRWRCWTFLALRRSTSGRPPPGVFRWSFARRHRLGHVP